jgi:MFS transporter, CP family, cyanate transporter
MEGQGGFRVFLLLWLCGVALRLTILAVPAVITEIQTELALSGTEVGILSGLPVVVFGLFAVPGSLVIARLGIIPALLIGLALAALGGALRGLFSIVAMLYAMTAVMAAGVAMLQVALPAAVRAWTPQRIVLATAVYTNGLLFGEIFPVALTQPLVMPWVGSWQASFVVWSVPFLLIAGAVMLMAPRVPFQPAGIISAWWPDWSSRLLWRIGLIATSIMGTYFAANAFLPPHLAAHGRADLITAALTALNVGQLPASFLLMAFAKRVDRRAWPFIGFALSAVASVAATALTASGWTVLWAAVIGFACGGALTVCLTLPPLLGRQDEVARLSAGMMTIGYGLGVASSTLAGVAWDIGGHPSFAFLPIGLLLLPWLLLPAGIPFGQAARQTD